MDQQFTTQAFNFPEAVQGSVDPRTGLFNLNLECGKLIGNANQGPSMHVALCYSPLQQSDLGLGIGFSIGHSYYDSKGGWLVLSSGERYRVAGSLEQPIVLQKHTDHFHFECVSVGAASKAYRIVWKDGTIEMLAGPDTVDAVKMPYRIVSPLGHSLLLAWDYDLDWPRLTTVHDDAGVKLLMLAYETGTSASLCLWPGTAEEQLVTLSFFNGYTRQICSADHLVTELGYVSLQGSEADQKVMDRVSYPTGLVERVVYAPLMRFPDRARLAALPAVSRHTLQPGAGQPDIVRTYAYSGTNYLACDFEGDWSSSLDPLYGTLTDYRYWSEETAGTAGTKTVTTRVYNALHLLVSEKTESGHCCWLRETEYFAELGKPLTHQPRAFLLPKKQTQTWTDKSLPAGKQVRREVTENAYDDAGNLISHVAADGTCTQWTYYPAAGEKDAAGQVLCPPEPNGFVRLLKHCIEIAPTVMAHGQALKVPSNERYYSYRSIDTRKGAPVQTGVSHAVVKSGEQHYLDGRCRQTLVHAYVDAPDSAEHGRLREITTKHHTEEGVQSYVSRQELGFTLKSDRLVQKVVISTHDGLSLTYGREQSRYSGRMLALTDTQGLRTTYRYDALGRLLRETRNAGGLYERVTQYTHVRQVGGAEEGVYLLKTEAGGNQTRTRLDGLGRPIQAWQLDRDRAAGQAWREMAQWNYDDLGRMAARTGYDWLGGDHAEVCVSEQYSYDAWGQLAAVTTSDGGIHRKQTDPVARVVKTEFVGSDGTRGPTRLVAYDARWQPAEVREFIYRNGERLQYNRQESVHDGHGRLCLHTDALGHATRYEFDGWGRLIRTVLPDGSVVTQGYEPFCMQPLVNVIGVHPAAGSPVTLGTQSFDGLGRPRRSICGLRAWAYHYDSDAARAPAMVTAPDQVDQHYTYVPELDDAMQSVKASNASGELVQSIQYGPAGLADHAEASPGDMSETSTWYPSGRLKAKQIVIAGKTRSTGYTYSLAGRLCSYTDVAGVRQQCEYDTAGRLARIVEPSVTIELKYDGLGRLKGWEAKDASSLTLATTLELDTLGREFRRTIHSSRGSNWVIEQTWYPNHQLETRTLRASSTTTLQEHFVYDNRGRLSVYTCSGDSLPRNTYGKRVTRQEFHYDALDNVTRCVSTFADGSNTATYTYSVADPCQLASITNTHPAWPHEVTLVYDKAGRLKVDEQGRSLEYDALGRLIGVSAQGKPLAAYGYDAGSRLVLQKYGDKAEALYYRADTLVARLQDGALTQHRRLIRMGQTCVAEVGSQDERWLLGTNGQASVTLALRCTAHESEPAAFAYGPYGERLGQQQMPSALVAYTGEHLDPASDVYHLGNGYRTYSPALARFTCPDDWSPFGAGGLNAYAYCAGDPINRSDPSGHLSWQAWMGIGLGIGGLALTAITAGASIAAAGGVFAALSSASAVSLAVGTVGVAADAAAIASGATEQTNPKASAMLGWVALAAGALGAGSGIVRAGRRMVRSALAGSSGRGVALGTREEVTWGRNITNLKAIGRSSGTSDFFCTFEDVYKGERRINALGHAGYNQAASRAYVGIDGADGIDFYDGHELAEMLQEVGGINFSDYRYARMLMCHSASGGYHSIAAEFARTSGLATKGFIGKVTTYGRVLSVEQRMSEWDRTFALPYDQRRMNTLVSMLRARFGDNELLRIRKAFPYNYLPMTYLP